LTLRTGTKKSRDSEGVYRRVRFGYTLPKEKMMAMTPERRVKAKVRKVLDALGAYYVMPVTGGYGNSGAPDFLVCLRGRFVGIECKAGKNTTTPLQEKNLRQIEKSGGVSLVVNDENVGVFETELSSVITKSGEMKW
jgi:hypothetical protein